VPSELCHKYRDNSDLWATQWDAVYLPPILKRVQKLIKGDLKLQQSEVALGMYLCGFESQIMGKRSEWCGVWKQKEVEG
jgi:acid phosphatase